MSTLVTIFIIATAVAVIIQAGILVGLFFAVRKTTQRVDTLTTKAIPTIETAQSMMVELRPRITDIVTHVDESARMARAQMERLDVTVSDVVDRTRLQVIRADELVSRTMDRVEETTEMVHKTVISPIRQLSGLVTGLSAGIEYFLGRRRRQRGDGVGVPQDELFI
jgi:hypothetical protein